MKTSVTICSWLLPLGVAALACADTVWNKQGVAIDGEVIADEPEQPLVFRCKHKGEWKTFEIARDEIARYQREPGDQSDGVSVTKDGATEGGGKIGEAGESASADVRASGRSTKGINSCRELRPLIEAVLPPAMPGSSEVVILHLNGPFTRANIFDVGSTISAGVFDVLVDIASARKPVAIVLRVNSGGGQVDQMDHIVERLLKEQDVPNKRRIVAWVDLGGSAAALTSLACKELVMMPQGRLGAAIRTRGDGEVVEPKNVFDQKQEAMRDARRRQVAALTGRPSVIQDAMERAEHQFWHHPVLGFSLEEQSGDGWEAYDTDGDKPLALEAKALVDLGIAVGIAADARALLTLLKIPEGTKVIDIDLLSPEVQVQLRSAKEFAKAGNGAVEAFKKKLKKEIDDTQLAIRAAAGILTAQGGYTAEDIRTFRNALAKLSVPAIDKKTKDYLKGSDPEMLAFYEDRLAMARRVFQRASQSTETAVRSGAIAIGPILDDLRFAAKNLAEVVIDGELRD